jgi:hypothetical protein
VTNASRSRYITSSTPSKTFGKSSRTRPLRRNHSEASRRIPEEWKAEHPLIPWPKVAGIGSVLRHNYENVSPEIITELRGAPLAQLKDAVLALLDKYDPEGVPFRKR